jgi:hypothetical protein
LRFFYLQHLVHFDAIQLDNLFHSQGFRKVTGGQRLRVENELIMPAIWAMYEHEKHSQATVIADFSLAEKVRAWFDAAELDPGHEFAKLAQTGNRVYVWGLGIHVQMLLGMSPLRDCHIVCFVDQDTKLHERTILGRKIMSPAVLAEATPQDAVVIGSLIHRQKMLRHLREEVGFSGQIVCV